MHYWLADHPGSSSKTSRMTECMSAKLTGGHSNTEAKNNCVLVYAVIPWTGFMCRDAVYTGTEVFGDVASRSEKHWKRKINVTRSPINSPVSINTYQYDDLHDSRHVTSTSLMGNMITQTI